MTAESIRTTASVSLDKTEAGFTITAVHLEVTAKIPGADQQAFETAANNAKAGCPVSKVLNARITIGSRLTPGNKIIQMVNNYDKEVFNGDI